MPQTVIITLTVAGLDTGPFSLYSDVDGYVTPFETGVTKPSLLVGYVSTLVPDAATIIRVKSVNELCTNYIDLTIPTTTTTTTSSSTTSTTSSTTTSTTSTSTTSTTSTTTTAFCVDCRNWNYVSGNIPAEGDVIHWYSCEDGSPQTRALSFGDPDGSFCNCNTVGNPYSDNGTILTEIGICVPTTTTTTTQAVIIYSVQPCGGGQGPYKITYGTGDVPTAIGEAFKLLLPGSPFDGAGCWEIVEYPVEGPADYEAVAFGTAYNNCEGCPETTTTTTTPTPPAQFTLNYSDVSGPDACSGYGPPCSNCSTYFAAPGATLANGLVIYTTYPGTTAPDGYYSDGTNWWQISGGLGAINNQTPC